MTTQTKQIEDRAREIAGCLFDDANGTLIERIQYCIDFQPLGTDGDLSDADRAELRELLAELGGNVMLHGKPVDYDAAVNLMDDDIRERLHADLAPCTNQEFLDAYVAAHAEKFDGETFQVN